MKFFSRSGLDQLLFENFFRGKRGGVFVDAGAADGETSNNSLFFERFMDWRGLCVEPRPEVFAKLAALRCIGGLEILSATRTVHHPYRPRDTDPQSRF